MSYNFDEVLEGDFMKFGKPLSFIEIERTLLEIGGGGVKGTEYKHKALQAAGWTGHALTNYASRPAIAAKAFNQVRLALAQLSKPDPEVLLESIKALAEA